MINPDWIFSTSSIFLLIIIFIYYWKNYQTGCSGTEGLQSCHLEGGLLWGWGWPDKILSQNAKANTSSWIITFKEHCLNVFVYNSFIDLHYLQDKGRKYCYASCTISGLPITLPALALLPCKGGLASIRLVSIAEVGFWKVNLTLSFSLSSMGWYNLEILGFH